MNPSSPAGAAQPNNIFKPVNLTGGQGTATLDRFTSPQIVGGASQPVQPVATASRPYPVENLESTETSALDNPISSEQSGASQPELSSINSQNQPNLNNKATDSSSQNADLSNQGQGPGATLKKIITIVIVILLLGTAGYFIWRSRQAQQLTGSDFTDQTVELGPESSGLEDLGIESEEEKLIVQGDLITQGDVYISTNSNLGILAQITGNLTENRTFVLPDESGTFCLDANNCNFVLEEDFITTTINGFADAVTIQGTTNQVAVSNAGNTITLSTPQNIGTTSSPSFNSITLSVAGTQDGNEICDASNNCGYAGGTDAYIQNGNSFGAAAVLGTNDANSLSFETSDTTRMTITSGGDVNIINDLTVGSQLAVGSVAAITAGTTLSVTETTTATSGNIFGLNTELNVSAASASTASIIGNSATVDIESGNIQDYESIVGAYGEASHNGTGSLSQANGLAGTTYNTLSGNIGSAAGTYGAVINSGSGNITDANGLVTIVWNSGSGNITNAYGTHVLSLLNTGAGSIDTSIGIKVDGQSFATNSYGVVIDEASTQSLWLTGNDGGANTGIGFGISLDTNLYRSGANILSTDDYLTVGAGGIIKGFNASIERSTSLLDVLPASHGLGAAFSPNSQYLIQVHDASSPFMAIYEVNSDDTFTKLADPASLPPGDANGIEFSPNGQYVAIAHDTTPFITIYEVDYDADTFTKLGNPASLPTGNGEGVRFSPDGKYMAVAHTTSPFITIYEVDYSTDTFTKISDPATLPASTGRAVVFSPDGKYMSVAHSTSPFVTIYEIDASTNTFTKLANPASLPSSAGFSAAFSPNGQYMAIGNDASTFLTIYEVDADTNTFTKIADPATLPTGKAWAVDFSPDGQFLAVGHTNAPRMTAYEIDSATDTFTKIDDATLSLNGNGRGLDFSPDGRFLAVAQVSTPFLSIYRGLSGTAPDPHGAIELAISTDRFGGISLGRDLQLFRSDVGSLVIQGTTNSSDTLAVQNASSTNVLTVDTISNKLVLGTASSVNGNLTLNSKNGSRAVMRTNNENELLFEFDDVEVVKIAEDGLSVASRAAIGADASIATGTSLAVADTFTTYNASAQGLTNTLTIAPTQNKNCGLFCLDIASVNRIQTDSGNAFNTSLMIGGLNEVLHQGSGTISTAWGLVGGVTTSGSGDISEAQGVNVGITHDGSGDITTAKGLYINVANGGGGTIGTAYGIDIAGVTNVTTTAYGLNVADITGATSSYGVVIQGADTYALWVGAGADNTDAANGITFGNSADTNLYRGAASRLTTDDSLHVNGGDLGVGTTPGTYKLDVADDASATYVANFFNDGNNADRYGIQIQAGADDGSGTTYYLNALDGDGTQVGYIANTAGTFALTDISDIRTKTNVQDTANDASSILAGLRVVDFNRLQDPDGPTITGFIAQEVQQVYSQAVTVSSGGLLGVQKDAFIPILVKGHQDQQLSLQSLDSRLTALETAQPQSSSTTDLTLESLSVLGATELSTLKVSGATSLANLTVSGDATFVGDIAVKGDLLLEGKILGNQHTRGTVTIEEGATEVEFTFDKPFSTAPNMVLTATNAFTPAYRVETSKTKFTLYLEEPATVDTIFNYQVQQ